MKHFRIKTGYGKDDFISIDETELSKALRAQVNGSVAIFKEGSISGNNIMAVIPDFQKEMGYRRDYQLTGEDYELIGQEKIKDYRLAIEEAKIGDIKLLK